MSTKNGETAITDIQTDAQAVPTVPQVEEPVREKGSLVEEEAIPFEVRPDGSIAHFITDPSLAVRETGSEVSR